MGKGRIRALKLNAKQGDKRDLIYGENNDLAKAERFLKD
jgi:hypothetical protein